MPDPSTPKPSTPAETLITDIITGIPVVRKEVPLAPVSPAKQGHGAANLARRFHETYERLAPNFGYETRKESAKPWADVPERNKNLMIAVCAEILSAAPVSPEAASTPVGYVTEVHPDPKPPSCSYCGAEMVPERYKCLSCGQHTGCTDPPAWKVAKRCAEIVRALKISMPLREEMFGTLETAARAIESEFPPPAGEKAVRP